MFEGICTRGNVARAALICFSLAQPACGSSATPTVPSDSSGNGNGNGNGTGKGNGTGNGTGNGNGSSNGNGASDAGASSGGPSNGSGTTSGPQLYLWSDSINGGFDGQHPFLIPTSAVLVQDSSDADANADPVPVAFTHPPTFAVADTSIATIAAAPTPNIPGAQGDPFFVASAYALITPKAAGKTTVTVTYDTQSVQADLYIIAYTPADVTLGQTRYTSPATPGPKRLACVGCHAPGSDAGVNAPVHDPFFQQDLTDTELLVIIEKGLYDANDPSSTLNVPGGHTWNLTTDEEKAIPSYLRSIPPEGF